MTTPVERLFGILEGQQRQVFRVLRGPYSQAELARKININPSSIDDWEAGRVMPQPRHVRELLLHGRDWAEPLGLKLQHIIDLRYDEEKEKTP